MGNSDKKPSADPLTYSPVSPPWNKFLDGWGVSHFFFYGLLGYLFPRRWVFIIVCGIIWELVEHVFGAHPLIRSYMAECNYLNTDGSVRWWYGRWEDIVMNTLGMILGIYISPYRI
jgi:hypothetical protein